jgi:hypothetical protein
MGSSLSKSGDEIRNTIGLTKIRFNIRFGKVLVDNGLVTEDDMARALATQEMGRRNGQNPLIGEIIERQCGISRHDIEKAFAEHLFRNLVRHFKSVILHDTVLLSYFDADKDFLEKLSIDIPFWDVENTDKTFISAKAVFLVKPKNHEEITLSLPFDYYVEDQVSNIDFIGAMEYLKSLIMDSKGGVSDLDMGEIGILLSEIKK